ncbi:MAG: NADH-quinone oxidoreductase subunit A [Deltaproteobacteria bacterium]|nr:NADH-quinone oxidoreductase subunit A [Deltaproteobacteria bacterium]
MNSIQPFENLSPWHPGIPALILFALAVLFIIAALVLIASFLGEKKPNQEKSRPYESGIIPYGSSRLRYSLPFFLVAIFFLIFDVEGSFIFSWAVACRELGWIGWIRMTLFILILLLGLIYIWRKGGLNWGSRDQKV